MKKSNVYTRTGDQGTTSLVGGTRVSKASAKLESYGTIDELNSHIGLLLTMTDDPDTQARLLNCQNCLFVAGAILATEAGRQALPFPTGEVEALERAIDQMHQSLPPWRGFTLPGGCQAAAQAHVCRTVCRRAERAICALAQTEATDPVLVAYVNRLSDYFYVLACHLNHAAGVQENLWQRKETE